MSTSIAKEESVTSMTVEGPTGSGVPTVVDSLCKLSSS